MATESKTTQHKIERRTYLTGEFNGKYQGNYYSSGSVRGKEEFYDLKVKEVLVSIPYPEGFQHWQSGEPTPFRNKKTTLLEFPAILECKLSKHDGSNQYARLNIKDVKVLSYRLSNQLYDGDFIYGDIEGELSGYIIHYDIEERVTFHVIEDEIASLSKISSLNQETTGEELGNLDRSNSSKGCWSTLIDTISYAFYALLGLMFLWLFLAMLVELFNKPDPVANRSSNSTVRKSEPYSPASRKPASSTRSEFPIFLEKDSSAWRKADLPPANKPESLVVPVEASGNDGESPKPLPSTILTGDGVKTAALDTIKAGIMTVDRSAVLSDQSLGVIDSFWIEIIWKDMKENTFYINYLIDANTLARTTTYRNELISSSGTIIFENWLDMESLRKPNASNGTTFFSNFKKMCAEKNLTGLKKRNALSSFIQSIHLLELRSGACPIPVVTPSSSSDPFGLDRTCVDSVHLEFFAPLEVVMNLAANPVSKAMLCFELAQYLDLPSHILYNDRSNQYALAFQLDPFDELGRYEVWTLGQLSSQQIMYSRQEVVLRGWTFTF